MKQTSFFSIYHIRKDELPGVIHTTLEIVQKHDPVVLSIKPFFDLLSEKETQLSQYSEPRQHPLSKLIDNDRKQRNDLVRAIEYQMNGVEKSKVSALTEAGSLIRPLITKYLNNFRQNNTKTADDKLKNFLSEIAGSTSLSEAAVTLAIQIYLDELTQLQKKLDEKSSKRREDKSTRQISSAIQLKNEIITSFTNLLRAIELAKVQHTGVDYMPLIAELREFLVPYRALNRSRKTRSRNEAIKNETVATSTTTSATAN